MFRALCAHHREVKNVLCSIWCHHTCRWSSGAQADRGLSQPVHRTTSYMYDDTRCCIIQFGLLMMSTYCSKHVEVYNKLIIEQEFVH